MCITIMSRAGSINQNPVLANLVKVHIVKKAHAITLQNSLHPEVFASVCGDPSLVDVLGTGH